MIFITDLDKTIIYSKYKDKVCIEYKDGEEITYMTPHAKEILYRLLSHRDFMLIPCTLRSFEQTSRIMFVSNEHTPVLICDNGFSVYHKGVLDLSWDTLMNKELSIYPNVEVYHKVKEYIIRNKISIKKIKSNRDAFYTVIFNDEETAKINSTFIIASIESNLYKFDLQGRKLYIIPKFLDKVLALRYIKSQYPNEFIVTAGDSSVDEAFVREGDIQLLPKHTSLNIPTAIITESMYINAGENIIETVATIFYKSSKFKMTL